MSKFSVYDKVWVMRNNKAVELMVYSVIEQMAFKKTETEWRYGLVKGTYGAGVGNNKEIILSEDSIFASKHELIDSL